MKYPRIRNLREDNDLTQQQIADMLYINRRTYAAYENGINSMTPETLCKIADIYHTSVDWLLGRTDELRYLLERRVHREHGHADIDNIDAEMRNILRDCSAAALIDLAEFAYLPDDVVLIEEFSELADELRIGVRCV